MMCPHALTEDGIESQIGVVNMIESSQYIQLIYLL
jgi:hypothetical protein